MKFLKSVFHYPSDAGPVEKILTFVFPIFVLIVGGYLILASYGVGNSNLAHAHQLLPHPASASVIATVLLAAAVLWAWFNWTDRIPFRVNEIIGILIFLTLIILAVNANTNFFSQVR